MSAHEIQAQVIGIDLSLTGTGIAILGFAGHHVELIKSKGKPDDDLGMRGERLRIIRNKIIDLIPDDALVVIEQPAYSQTGGSHHDRSGLWWQIVDWVQDAGFQTVEVAPTSVKKYATGKGNASKDQVLAAIVKRYAHIDVTDNNIADAVVLAAMGMRWLGHEIDGGLPLVNLSSMAAVRWTP